MAFPSGGVHVPGAFHAEGIHYGLFRPPVEPASGSGSLPAAVDDAATTRKRSRGDVSRPRLSRADDYLDDAGPQSGAPLATAPRAYALAGQLDTANGGPDDSAVLGESMYSDSNYRRALGCKRPRRELDDAPDPGRPTPLFALPTEPVPLRPWGAAALSTIGDVVGRVWEFCKAGAFRGFYAGGGTGYEVPAGDGYPCDAADEQGPRPAFFAPGGRRPPPGAEPEHETWPAGTSTPTAPAAKRRQTGPADELGRNWVLVKEPPTAADGAAPERQCQSIHRSSPRNRNQAPSVTTGRRISTPSSRRYSGRPNAFASTSAPVPEPPRPPSSASFASPRSPSPTKSASRAIPAVAGASTASPSHHAASGHARRRPLHASSSQPSLGHRRSHSSASAASSRGAAGDEPQASPRLDAEAKKLAARRKMEERDADVRIAALNRRLQDMIREGKEALGTRVEVDGGWEDDD